MSATFDRLNTELASLSAEIVTLKAEPNPAACDDLIRRQIDFNNRLLSYAREYFARTGAIHNSRRVSPLT